MLIKPLYLLADSQLLFWREGEQLFTQRLREHMDAPSPKAAYIGASNGDQPEFYSIFQSAMESIGISECRMVPSRISEDDKKFLEEANLILLAGGDVERGWTTFKDNGLKDLIPRKRYDGTLLVGISAGAVQLGLGALTGTTNMKTEEMFRFAPFFVGAHEEQEEWWNLRALVNLSQTEARGIGIPAGGGAIYYPDGTLEPVRKSLVEFSKEDDQVKEKLLLPENEFSRGSVP
jgi:cyanophycinase